MLQQQLNSAQLHSLAAVQQVCCQGAKGEELDGLLGKNQIFFSLYNDSCTKVVLIHGETMSP